MFFRIIFTLLLLGTSIHSRTGFEYAGIPIKIVDAKGKITNTIVKRDIPDVCKNIPINNKVVWTGNYASNEVPEACKSTFVHTTGKLLPIHLHEDIDTYGELEVLSFMKEMQSNDKMLLIDSRKQSWYDYRTIPGAINMPFHHFKERNAFEFEFEHEILTLGVTVDKNNEYNFKNAKTIVIFCNGSWCSQSVAMIDVLLEIDYPAEKIKWYRGGMQDWLSAGMTSTRSIELKKTSTDKHSTHDDKKR